MAAKQKCYPQKFRSEWMREKAYEKWLVPVPGNEALARCRFCSKNFSAKLQNVKIHRESEIHRKHERDRGLSSQSANLMEQFVNQGATQDSKTKKRKEAELKMSAFVALNTSFRVSSQLAGLVHATGVLQNPIYLAKY